MASAPDPAVANGHGGACTFNIYALHFPRRGGTRMTEADRDGDARIIASWLVNATPWTGAVRGRRIESRRLVTDQAVCEAVIGRSPATVLDVGCGEGWLARALSRHGI